MLKRRCRISVPSTRTIRLIPVRLCHMCRARARIGVGANGPTGPSKGVPFDKAPQGAIDYAGDDWIELNLRDAQSVFCPMARCYEAA
jgi:hypothetical protein